MNAEPLMKREPIEIDRVADLGVRDGGSQPSRATDRVGSTSETQKRTHGRGAGARLRYLTRVAAAYLGNAPSQLTFWHESPVINPHAFDEIAGEYYQCFFRKADYAAHLDENGIPLLDYRGAIGKQYNPIAIAQWGLGNFNLYRRTHAIDRRDKLVRAADWLVANLSPNDHGVPVWKHEFDWEYRDLLHAGWYSALAQGQGVSLLCRAYRETGDDAYRDTAELAFRSLTLPVESGGVQIRDGEDGAWLEETIVDPPTHILNGFLWALWGVKDYADVSADAAARSLLEACTRTLMRNLPDYDCGYWSLYEQSGTRMKMLASPFYHRLHVSQLRITARLLEQPELGTWADRWDRYAASNACAKRALAYKALFKVLYY
jgi:heparosan-N-sulfate-glucuronate 5-epimerase